MSSEARTTVLVVEDEAHILRFVRLALENEGHTVFEADTLARGLIEAASRCPDVVVLDLGLPDGDGVALIQALRGWSAAPVIVLSARSAEGEKITALDAGADDFLCKPFGVGELQARVRAQLRRSIHLTGDLAGGDASLLRFGDVVVDRARRVVARAGASIHLTPIEYRLLQLLSSQPGRVITHRQLLKDVWGPGHVEDVHYVRVHMGNLRKKLEPDPSRPRWLVTETGVGYRFVPDPA